MDKRPDGSPLATGITPDLRHWLCRGGLDPDRVLRLPGITEAMLVALWNVRVAARECDTASPADAAPPTAPRA